jgi:hypothetical protein
MMMAPSRLLAGARLVVLAAVLALPAMAAGTLEVHNQGAVAFVSGGVGHGERQALEAMSGRFNLKLTMALTNRDFVSDASVRIRDAQGQVVLDTVADGPLLFAQLKPGTYTVSCTLDGKEIHKTAQLTSGKQQQLVFTWPSE